MREKETLESFPIMLMQDRYGGVYSGGAWLAVAEASEMLDEANSRGQFCLISDNGPFGSDVEAGLFWKRSAALDCGRGRRRTPHYERCRRPRHPESDCVSYHGGLPTRAEHRVRT